MRALTRPLALAGVVVLLAACSPAAQTATPAPTAASTSLATPTPPATPGPGSACTPATAPAGADWTGRTWYEVFVRSFKDGDGDGIGDLAGLTAQLDYLNDGDPSTTTDLGVEGLWLMPIVESPSYHGYDVTDYRAVEPDYGTAEDLRALLEAAHARGIKVIVDLVMNHSSSEHPWFTASRAQDGTHDDWYVWADEDPGWRGPGGQTVWHQADGRSYYGVFWEGMPDLNLRNEAVTAELADIARFWLEDVGVDGFRLDAAKHLIEDGKDAQTNTPETKAWLAGFKDGVEAVAPDALLVGEVWDPPSIAGSYVPDSLDLTFDFGLASAVALALQNGRAAPLRTGLGDTVTAWPANGSASFLANHDQPRIMTTLGGDPAAARLAALILMGAPGTPFLYYGEEIGMTGTKPDERIRTPMRWTEDPGTAGFTTGEPWEPLSEDPAGTSVAAQADDPASLLAAYRALVRVRDASPALQHGATTIVDGGAEPVIGWLRSTGDETVLAVVNTSAEPVDAYALTLGAGPLCGPVTARLLGAVNDGGAGAEPASPASPVVTPEGGLDAYVPFPVLPPRSGFLLALEPAP